MGWANPAMFGLAGTAHLGAALYGLSLGSNIWNATHQPKNDNYSRFDIFMNSIDSTARIPVIYGTRKYGGLQSYHLASSDGKSLTKDIIISEGEIQGIYGITANELSIGSGNTSQTEILLRLLSTGGNPMELFGYNAKSTHVFSLINVKYADATLWITTGGSSLGDKVLHLYANGKTTEILLQHPSDLHESQDNDYSCYIYKLINYIGGIGYSTTLAAEGWLVVNPAITTDPPENIGNIGVTAESTTDSEGNTVITYTTNPVPCYNSPVSLGIAKLASENSSYVFHSGSATDGHPDNYMQVGGYRRMAWLRAHLVQTEQLQGGNPNITYICQGMKLWDTRTNTFGYSENPAMIVRDYLLSKRYGCGHFVTIEDLDEDAFKEAADYCDELVTFQDHNGNTITEPRYTLNIILDQKKKHIEHLQDMFASFGGFLVFTNGHIGLRIERSTPISYAFTDDTIIQDSIVYSAASTEQSPNRWNITYYDPSQNWTGIKCIVEDTIGQQPYPIGRGKVIPHDVTLVGTTRQSQASRLGRLMKDISILCPLRIQWQTATQAMHLEPGDVVTITKNVIVDGVSKVLFDGMPFRIMEISNNKGIYTIKGQQYNDSVYHDSLGSKITVKNYVPIASPISDAIPDVTNVNVSDTYYTQTDGSIVYSNAISWTLPGYTFFKRCVLYYSMDAGETWSSLGTTSDLRFIHSGVLSAKTYLYRIQVENTEGRMSNGAISNSVHVNGVTSFTKKYTTTIGNGVDTVYTINHGLNTLDVIVSIREATAPYSSVYPVINYMDANDISVTFTVAPTTGQYKVIIIS